MSKISEFLESIQTRLYEFANPISKTEDKITDLGTPVVEHLIKILKWDDVSHNRKHCKDIDNWLFQVERYFNKSKKKPKPGKVYGWMYGDTESTIKNVFKHLNRKYGKLPEYRTDFEVQICLKQILKEVDDQLHQNGSIDSIVEICEYLDIELRSTDHYWK